MVPLKNYWYRFTANRLGKQHTKFEEGKFTQPRERAFKTWTFGKYYKFLMRVFPDTSSFNALLSVLAFKIHLLLLAFKIHLLLFTQNKSKLAL